jgi:hypothetical protein
MKLENRKQKVAPLPNFLFRLGRYGLFALALIVFSVLIGTMGYHHFAAISWLDSFSHGVYDFNGDGTGCRNDNYEREVVFIDLRFVQWGGIPKYHSCFLCAYNT